MAVNLFIRLHRFVPIKHAFKMSDFIGNDDVDDLPVRARREGNERRAAFHLSRR